MGKRVSHAVPHVIAAHTDAASGTLGLRRSHVQLASEVSRLIRPAAYLEGLADTIVSEMTTRRGERAFNGVHLRLEQDSPYVEMMGGLEASLNPAPPLALTLSLTLIQVLTCFYSHLNHDPDP